MESALQGHKRYGVRAIRQFIDYEASSLSRVDVLVWLCLWAHERSGDCTVLVDDMANRLRCDRVSVIRGLRALRDAGLIVRLKKGCAGRASTYRLLALKPCARQRRSRISPRLRFSVFKRDDFRCVYCGATQEDSPLHVDHAIAASNGGSDEITNLVTACADCNLGKHSENIDPSGIPALLARKNLTPALP